jgi:hypothetical protein
MQLEHETSTPQGQQFSQTINLQHLVWKQNKSTPG